MDREGVRKRKEKSEKHCWQSVAFSRFRRVDQINNYLKGIDPALDQRN
jgi:hypothetical protein